MANQENTAGDPLRDVRSSNLKYKEIQKSLADTSTAPASSIQTLINNIEAANYLSGAEPLDSDPNWTELTSAALTAASLLETIRAS